MYKQLIIIYCFLFTACASMPPGSESNLLNKILSQAEAKINYENSCSEENKIIILDVYSEAKVKYKEAASNRAGRIAQNVIKFKPTKSEINFSIQVTWNNKNGNGVFNDKGKLSEDENASGELFWRFSLPGTYDLFWTLTDGECKVNIETGFSVGKTI